MNKREKLIQRRKRVRSKIVKDSARPRLSVFRSNKYLYAQIIDDVKAETLVSVSEKKIKPEKGKTKTQLAEMMGEELAKSAKAKKITSVVFDRGGYKYHGRVKAFAEAAKKGGLVF